MIRSSQAAVDLIVMEEVSSKKTYEAKYTHPEWPGGASGVTIGIGYDVGYSTPTIVQGDWGNKLPVAMVAALGSVVGIVGSPAASHAHELRNVVTVPWEAAIQRRRPIPRNAGDPRSHGKRAVCRDSRRVPFDAEVVA